MKSGEVFMLCDGRVRATMIGQPENMRPPTTDDDPVRIEEFLKSTRVHRHQLGAGVLIAPRPGNTNLVVQDSDSEIGTGFKGSFDFLRTRAKADGIITTDRHCALAYCVADCHVGVMVDPDPKRPWLALLHLGTANLLKEPTVIERAVELSGRPPQELMFAFGFGIGPCCYGLPSGHPNLAELHRLYSMAVDLDEARRVERGPRTGQVAIDLGAGIMQEALRLEINNIESHFGDMCTAHHGRQNGTSTWHSHVYQEGRGNKRNMFMVCLAHD